MTSVPVDAVFFWRADMTAAFKAVYGRKPDGTTYTKDFHQPRSEQARAIERAFGIALGGDTPVTWKWPGGEYTQGRFKPAADFDPQSGGRMNLRWETDNAPAPWRLTSGPTATSLSTLQGTPDLTLESQANAQLESIRGSGESPWFVAVHLAGDGPVLHARLVLENPTTGREYASWATVPKSVRDAMSALPGNKTGGFVEFQEGVPMRAGEIVKQVMEAFKDNPNVLLVGPPGTGKSVAMEDIRRAYEQGAETTEFDPEKLHAAFGTGEEAFDGETRVRSLVFHPSFAYEDFVMGLLPHPVDGGGVTVRPRVGPLLDLAHFASKPKSRALLICDEFNRGAAAAIFGDTLALLDGDKRSIPGDAGGGATIDTPYFSLIPETPGGEPLDKQTSLPSTLRILAAMNSADRSVAPLDAALRRRFAIIYIGPDYDVLRSHLDVAEDFELGEQSTWNTPMHVSALAIEVLKALNERIEVVVGRDFLLGHSVMWDVGGDTYPEALSSLAVALDNRVMGTLGLSFVDNDAALAAVLNVPGSDTPLEDVRAAVWHVPNESISQVASPRLRVKRFQQLEGGELAHVLATLLD